MTFMNDIRSSSGDVGTTCTETWGLRNAQCCLWVGWPPSLFVESVHLVAQLEISVEGGAAGAVQGAHPASFGPEDVGASLRVGSLGLPDGEMSHASVLSCLAGT